MVRLVGKARVYGTGVCPGWKGEEGGIFLNTDTTTQCYGCFTYGSCYNECTSRHNDSVESYAWENDSLDSWLVSKVQAPSSTAES